MGHTARTADSVESWVRRRLPALLRSYRVDEAYLFGSWARDEADEQSDIDLIIVAPSQRPFVDRFRDYPALWQKAPTGIDLLIYTPEEFVRQRRHSRFIRHVLRRAQRIL